MMRAMGQRFGNIIGWCVLVAALTAAPVWAESLGTDFTYQGRLTLSGQPATGSYDFSFALYDALEGGNQVGTTFFKHMIYVNDGAFSVKVDFGPRAFDGQARWVQIGVRVSGTGDAYTQLSPRQPLTASPYALFARSSGGMGNGWVTVDQDLGVVTYHDAELEVRDPAEQIRILNYRGTAGEGALALWGSNNALNVDLSSGSDDGNFGYVGAADDRGEIQAAMAVSEDGTGGVSLWGPADSLNVALTALSGENDHGYIGVADERGETQAGLYVFSSGEGGLTLWGPNDKLNVDLSASSDDSNMGYVGVADDRGEVQAAMGIFDSGEGGITTWGANDKINVDISSDSGDKNHGFVGVGDAAGVIRAGLYVDDDGDGIVFGDYKYFVVDYPNRPGSQIVYVSLEGPEAGIYERGVATLINGRAKVTLPDHFMALVSTGTLTVQLTPASFDSRGVGFAIGKDGTLEIRELNAGMGNYDVHYLVQGVRAGAEDHQPVVSNAQFKARYGRPVANGPQMKSRAGKTSRLAGSTAAEAVPKKKPVTPKRP